MIKRSMKKFAKKTLEIQWKALDASWYDGVLVRAVDTVMLRRIWETEMQYPKLEGSGAKVKTGWPGGVGRLIRQ